METSGISDRREQLRTLADGPPLGAKVGPETSGISGKRETLPGLADTRQAGLPAMVAKLSWCTLRPSN
jgi:hypothetical protein